ncbi:ATP-binding cassette domain-containing protein [Candidatus Saccharibacteria bacterium]|nr:ATP-binding cassette domain-containing protein [Candidatus Saccharibacteria bacterium]
MSSSEYAIEVKNLAKSYKDNKVLQGIDFRVKRGTMLALLGPNGAGKTTIVRILSTLLTFDKGSVTVEGYDAKRNPEKIRSVIGLTSQSATVDEMLTGRENLIMMGRLYRLTKTSARERANELLVDFSLVNAADRPAKTYSGGMRRRLDLAVSLIAAPPIIFLDEPTTGLDPRSRIAMWDIIRKLMKDGTTILLTTQYLEEADQLADNIILIDDGKIAAEGTAKELKSKMGNDKLELVFKNEQDLISAKSALKNKNISEDKSQFMLTVPVSNTNKDVKATLDALNEEGIAIEALALHKPTLDDVFLSITSKQDLPKKGKN